MRRELLQERDLRSTQVSQSVASSLLNKATIQLSLLGSSARVKASASLACRKGDGRFRPKTDFSAFLSYVGFGSILLKKSKIILVQKSH
jgi:hypothetical protein